MEETENMSKEKLLTLKSQKHGTCYKSKEKELLSLPLYFMFRAFPLPVTVANNMTGFMKLLLKRKKVG